MTTPTGAIDSAMISSSKMHLSNLISMLLLVKAMAPKGTLVVISRVIILAVQTLESGRTRYTCYSCLPRGLDLGLALQHQANSLWFSTL